MTRLAAHAKVCASSQAIGLVRISQRKMLAPAVAVSRPEEWPGGEPVTAVVQAATVNAVSKALNRRVRQLPMTPEALSRV